MSAVSVRFMQPLTELCRNIGSILPLLVGFSCVGRLYLLAVSLEPRSFKHAGIFLHISVEINVLFRVLHCSASDVWKPESSKANVRGHLVLARLR